MKRIRIPTATLVAYGPTFAVIECPYCTYRHTHKIEQGRGGPQWRAPGCGLSRSEEQRERGYRFTTPTNTTK